VNQEKVGSLVEWAPDIVGREDAGNIVEHVVCAFMGSRRRRCSEIGAVEPAEVAAEPAAGLGEPAVGAAETAEVAGESAEAAAVTLEEGAAVLEGMEASEVLELGFGAVELCAGPYRIAACAVGGAAVGALSAAGINAIPNKEVREGIETGLDVINEAQFRQHPIGQYYYLIRNFVPGGAKVEDAVTDGVGSVLGAVASGIYGGVKTGFESLYHVFAGAPEVAPEEQGLHLDRLGLGLSADPMADVLQNGNFADLRELSAIENSMGFHRIVLTAMPGGGIAGAGGMP